MRDFLTALRIDFTVCRDHPIDNTAIKVVFGFLQTVRVTVPLTLGFPPRSQKIQILGLEGKEVGVAYLTPCYDQVGRISFILIDLYCYPDPKSGSTTYVNAFLALTEGRSFDQTAVFNRFSRIGLSVATIKMIITSVEIAETVRITIRFDYIGSFLPIW